MRRPAHLPAALPALALALLAAAAAAACSTTPADRTGQTTQGFYAPDFDAVWDHSEQALRKSGFAPDPEESGKAGKTIISRWNVTLMPFSGKGHREQATVYIHDVPNQPNRWTVEVNVVRQANMNMKEPSNPIRAQWDGGERVPEAEAKLAYDIETFWNPYDVSDEFRRRYGMPPARKGIPAPTPVGAGSQSKPQ